MEKIETGEIITMIDDNGYTQDMEVLGTLTLEGKEYAAVGYAEELQKKSDEEIEVFFLRVDDEEQLSIIENNGELEKVTAAFNEAEEK
ncbi:DUF1292 domain-containing protein [Domibacillus robiginosus]|uniref:DUF1292 domain-containing protein n=1 Tax=Domibacillus robiginosus TaxID=1071054 RepID=UPI00067D887E|nr:DUF1292 domain-containing protein [Domibacillus robiginosus]